MIDTIFARKTGVEQHFDAKRRRQAVTVLSVLPMKVAAIRTPDNHGYAALQITAGERVKREVRVSNSDLSGFAVEQTLPWQQILTVGDRVNVTGVSKGKGFAGVVKKYHFQGGPRTHGQSDRERARGSSGPTTTPGRVLKGKRMAGRMGHQKVTTKNLKVAAIDADKATVLIQGAVPGYRSSLVILRRV